MAVAPSLGRSTVIGPRPDPFFEKYDKAKLIVEGTVTGALDTQEKITLPILEPFQGAPVKKATLKVEKVWKGDARAGQSVIFYFLADTAEFSKRAKSIEQWNLYLPDSIHNSEHKCILYLRQDKERLVTAGRFGSRSLAEPLHKSIKAELSALEAMSQGKPEAEVVGLLEGPENRQYKIDLEKHGKIKRGGR